MKSIIKNSISAATLKHEKHEQAKCNDRILVPMVACANTLVKEIEYLRFLAATFKFCELRKLDLEHLNLDNRLRNEIKRTIHDVFPLLESQTHNCGDTFVNTTQCMPDGCRGRRCQNGACGKKCKYMYFQKRGEPFEEVLRDGRVLIHKSSGLVFVCRRYGNYHVCDDSCDKTTFCNNHEGAVCKISGWVKNSQIDKNYIIAKDHHETLFEKNKTSEQAFCNEEDEYMSVDAQGNDQNMYCDGVLTDPNKTWLQRIEVISAQNELFRCKKLNYSRDHTATYYYWSKKLCAKIFGGKTKQTRAIARRVVFCWNVLMCTPYAIRNNIDFINCFMAIVYILNKGYSLKIVINGSYVEKYLFPCVRPYFACH